MSYIGCSCVTGQTWLQCCYLLRGKGSFRTVSVIVQRQMVDEFSSAILLKHVPPTHESVEIEFYSFPFLFPIDLNEVGLTCRPRKAGKPKEGETCEHATRGAVWRRDAHQSNRLERSSSGPGGFQSFDRIRIDSRPDSSPVAIWTVSVNREQQIEKINPHTSFSTRRPNYK
jgi:hypothetical protein